MRAQTAYKRARVSTDIQTYTRCTFACMRSSYNYKHIPMQSHIHIDLLECKFTCIHNCTQMLHRHELTHTSLIAQTHTHTHSLSYTNSDTNYFSRMHARTSTHAIRTLPRKRLCTQTLNTLRKIQSHTFFSLGQVG